MDPNVKAILEEGRRLVKVAGDKSKDPKTRCQAFGKWTKMICDVYCNWNHIDRKQWLIEEQRVSQWLDEIDDIGSHNAYKYFESEDDIGDVCLLRNAGGNVKALRNLEGK